MTTTDKLIHLRDYLNHRLDIIYSDFSSWQGLRKHNLPTFDYYMENCVEDKGGAYDFTVRRYWKNDTLTEDTNVLHESRDFKSTKVVRKTSYSIWMGTPFNYKCDIKIS